jgi:putative ABC transport system ATP-binding protein
VFLHTLDASLGVHPINRFSVSTIQENVHSLQPMIFNSDTRRTQPILVARDLYKSFGSGQRCTPILRGVSLSVDHGETVFLVGPSGSGKTTLLSLIGCLLGPDSGSIEVLGHDINQMRREELTAFRRQYLGFVFQTFNLFPNLSAADNVQLALSMRGVPTAEAKARSLELLAHVGLGDRARLRPAQLSTGECQRVAVARALAGGPAILFADEPTASLDAENGQAVLRLLQRLVREQGLTLIIVTHDNRIFPYADRILRLEDGRLASEHSAASAHATVLAHPAPAETHVAAAGLPGHSAPAASHVASAGFPAAATPVATHVAAVGLPAPSTGTATHMAAAGLPAPARRRRVEERVA